MKHLCWGTCIVLLCLLAGVAQAQKKVGAFGVKGVLLDSLCFGFGREV